MVPVGRVVARRTVHPLDHDVAGPGAEGEARVEAATGKVQGNRHPQGGAQLPPAVTLLPFIESVEVRHVVGRGSTPVEDRGVDHGEQAGVAQGGHSCVGVLVPVIKISPRDFRGPQEIS